MSNTSQQSNPYSTGGGGVNFETRVQAAFTVLMLADHMSERSNFSPTPVLSAVGYDHSSKRLN